MSAPSTAAPVVTEGQQTDWLVVDLDTGGVMFHHERRERAEEWMLRLAKDRPQLALRSEHRRWRCETWYDEPVTVPWHSRCGWVRGVDEPESANRCHHHGWHRQDEPVPAEFWRPQASGDGQAEGDSGA